MSDAVLYSLDGKILVEAAETDPLLYRELFAEAGHHLKTCVHSIENISLGTANSRVEHELLFSIKEFGVKVKEGVRLALPLTHQDIADALGITRETVSKSIARLREEGVIVNTRRFGARHLKALEDAANNK
jgi:CRP/FNR family transcriptional regulator